MGACNACNVKGQDELNEITCQMPDQVEGADKPQVQPQPLQKGPSTPNQGSSEAPTKGTSDANSPRSDDEAPPSPERPAEEQSAQATAPECSSQPAAPVMEPGEERASLDDHVAPSPPAFSQEWMLTPSVGTWYLSRQTKWFEAARMAPIGDEITSGPVLATEAPACACSHSESVVCGGEAPATKFADPCDLDGVCWAAPEVIKPAQQQDALKYTIRENPKTPWARLPSVATWASISYLPAFDREAVALREVATFGAEA